MDSDGLSSRRKHIREWSEGRLACSHDCWVGRHRRKNGTSQGDAGGILFCRKRQPTVGVLISTTSLTSHQLCSTRYSQLAYRSSWRGDQEAEEAGASCLPDLELTNLEQLDSSMSGSQA